MQSVSFRIWTRVAVSISHDDNDYTTGTSKFSVIDTSNFRVGISSGCFWYMPLLDRDTVLHQVRDLGRHVHYLLEALGDKVSLDLGGILVGEWANVPLCGHIVFLTSSRIRGVFPIQVTTTECERMSCDSNSVFRYARVLLPVRGFGEVL